MINDVKASLIFVNPVKLDPNNTITELGKFTNVTYPYRIGVNGKQESECKNAAQTVDII